MNQLHDTIAKLSQLDHDTLRNAADVAHYLYWNAQMAEARSRDDLAAENSAKHQRGRVFQNRRGLPGVFEVARSLPHFLVEAMGKVASVGRAKALGETERGTLSKDELLTLLYVLNAMTALTRPIAASRTVTRTERRTVKRRGAEPAGGLPDDAPRQMTYFAEAGKNTAKGTEQIKSKWVNQRGEDGKPMVNEDGEPVMKRLDYLYLRVYTAMPQPDGTRKSRIASIYIGSLTRLEHKPFLAAYLDESDTSVTREKIIEVFQTGGYGAVKRWRQSLDD